MNKHFAAALVAFILSPSVHADAGGRCHFHGSKAASETTVTGCAQQRVEALVKAGKLDASWQQVAAPRLEQVDGKKGKEWKLSYRNPAVSDPSRQTLYLFFTMPGNFIAANHTGQ
jgi:Family of unknown function (DUF6488)